MGVNIRLAKLSDYRKISVISKELHLYHLENRPDIYKEVRKTIYRAYFNELLKDRDVEVFVITLDENIVGYSIIRYINLKDIDLLNDKYFAYIDEICIKKAFRRQGLGRIFFEYIYTSAKNKGVDTLELGVWSFNKSAIDFYRAMGMVEKNIRMEKK
ncbi:GNAT family N-acetyltransferase [Clostridium sp. AL.422]|uniref:GNAT family N-acetyltransferase n=1 Tax=Clostridium TaxID=1485 RepID=UPI00293DD878|nr:MULTISPECIES: GNAT family N-acetyltransferase [unclassified Clostridium]MDV4151940.1 GNAT family N-acetyltransferase [Clostridium sp. AL.422]